MEIDKYVDSYVVTVGNMDMTTFEPLSCFEFHPLFDKLWVELFERIMNSDISIEKIASTISGVSYYRAQIFFLLIDMKSAKISKERREKLAEFLIKILLQKAHADPHGTQSNIGHTFEELDSIMQKPFTKGTPEIARALGQLFATSYHLTNGLYTDFYTDYSVEYYGPYQLSRGRSLVIKHFEDLQPTELWPEGNAPCKTFTIYSIYENVKFSCDAISCHSFYEGDVMTGLKEFCLEVDGQQITDIDEIKEFTKRIEKESITQWQRLTSLDHETMKQKVLLMKHYVFKDLFSLFGDWKPSVQMKKTVKGKPYSTYWQPPERDQQKFWADVIHPSVEFYG